MYNNYYFRPENQLIADITKAINGEYSAIACYQQLARMAPTQEARDQILEIRNDEIRHFQVFSEIYTTLTGGQLTPQITEECPSDYRSGLVTSFKDEQETTDFYLDIAEKLTDPTMKEHFKRASADEQNHAVWFLYFLTHNQY
ncbi:ferritin-like domain-containing protein [Anaerobacillus sp. CMMVII]|uniref:ferritin-like domain-containing protein n=1 Tax=Anaerobacillus sp. CMMVII TaxID=2755588 RepID=UPI0021B71B04|nr:ferritin-like domain-containing protein [Anaerobacillus sp. CMMVII]MCT8137053.1 ferritin-like domain-containing protein [Anaerobacillus sp. CMMVII]